MLLNNDLRLNLFGLETHYYFDMVVCICLEKAIYAYFNTKYYQFESRNLGCSFKVLKGIFLLVLNIKPPPN